MYRHDCHAPTFLFRLSKIKLEGHHFDTLEVIEAESQVGLNTLIEYNFQDAFNKWQNIWEWYLHGKGTTSRLIVASRPKVRF
jgi:hypothetical protein